MLPIKTREVMCDINDRFEQFEVLRIPNNEADKYQLQAKKLLRMLREGKRIGTNTSDIDIVAKPGIEYITSDNGILINDNKSNLSVSAIGIEDGAIIGSYERKKGTAVVWTEGQFLLFKGVFNILNVGVADNQGNELDSTDISITVEQCDDIDITKNESLVSKLSQRKNKAAYMGVIIKKPKVPLLLKNHLEMSSFAEIGLVREEYEYEGDSLQEVDNIANQYSQKQIDYIYKYADKIATGNVLIRHALEEMTYEGVRLFERLVQAKRQSSIE